MIWVALFILALLLWFIWKQLERIGDALHGLYRIARERQES